MFGKITKLVVKNSKKTNVFFFQPKSHWLGAAFKTEIEDIEYKKEKNTLTLDFENSKSKDRSGSAVDIMLPHLTEIVFDDSNIKAHFSTLPKLKTISFKKVSGYLFNIYQKEVKLIGDYSSRLFLDNSVVQDLNILMNNDSAFHLRKNLTLNLTAKVYNDSTICGYDECYIYNANLLGAFNKSNMVFDIIKNVSYELDDFSNIQVNGGKQITKLEGYSDNSPEKKFSIGHVSDKRFNFTNNKNELMDNLASNSRIHLLIDSHMEYCNKNSRFETPISVIKAKEDVLKSNQFELEEKEKHLLNKINELKEVLNTLNFMDSKEKLERLKQISSLNEELEKLVKKVNKLIVEVNFHKTDEEQVQIKKLFLSKGIQEFIVDARDFINEEMFGVQLKKITDSLDMQCLDMKKLLLADERQKVIMNQEKEIVNFNDKEVRAFEIRLSSSEKLLNQYRNCLRKNQIRQTIKHTIILKKYEEAIDSVRELLNIEKLNILKKEDKLREANEILEQEKYKAELEAAEVMRQIQETKGNTLTIEMG